MFKQISTLRTKLTALMTLLDNIQVHEDYIEIILPDNVVVTAERHLAIRTPQGKLLLNPRMPKGRKLDDHVAVLVKQQLLEKK